MIARISDAQWLTSHPDRRRIRQARRRQRVVPTEQIEKGHPSFNPASSTPACGGQRVVAYFGSFGLICFDMEGQKLWDFKMPLA